MSRLATGPPAFALLHAGGWDELIFVAAGLLIAWAVISFTGRRSPDDGDEEGTEESEDDASRPTDLGTRS